MRAYFYLTILALLVTGCNGEREGTVVEPAGTKYAVSDQDMDQVHQELTQSLSENEGMQVMTEVDFQNDLLDIEIELDPVRTVFFGNPEAGTPLLQQNQLVALDLPQHIALFEHNDNTFAMYNSVEFLQSRYGLQGSPELEQMSRALEDLTTSATGSTIREAEEQTVASNVGIITVTSELNFSQTHGKLSRTLMDNENWNVISEIDHAENATNAGMQLRPTRLFLVSNYYLQSTILKENLTAAVDLPYKFLVWEDTDGTAKVSYIDPNFIQERHQLTGAEVEMAEASTAFQDIVNFATTYMEDYDAPENTEMEFDDKEAF